MRNDGLELMPLEDIKQLGSAGRMSCSCGTFLHRQMCVHVMEDAMRKKIVKSIPATMSSRPVVPGAGASSGAKKKARRGGAYDWDAFM